jgi:hypothetical protein
MRVSATRFPVLKLKRKEDLIVSVITCGSILLPELLPSQDLKKSQTWGFVRHMYWLTI